MRSDNLPKRYHGFHQVWLNLIFISLLIMITSFQAFAHKVNVFAYVEGDTVFTESYFSDGRKCIDSKIEVFDRAGNKLLEGITNKNGEFSFKVSKKADLRIVLTAGMGHRAEYSLLAGDIPQLSQEKSENSQAQQLKQKIPISGIIKQKEKRTEVTHVDLMQMQSLIEDILGKKLKPIMREIKRSQEHGISVTEVIGGIGYIFGIMGIIIYFRNKKTKKN